MANENKAQRFGSVQTTFTKQKRELAKINELISQIRAQEKRVQRLTPDGQLETQERETYVILTPQEIAGKVLALVQSVVQQHGARQQANGVNKGLFEFMGISAELTVPQLRALQEGANALRSLVENLPMENLRVRPNCELDGKPAYAAPASPVKETKKRWVPYVTKDSERPLSYEEEYEEVLYQRRVVTIDHGLAAPKILALKEAIGDLETAIQTAIDEANAKPHCEDKILGEVIAKIVETFQKQIDG